jgi:hypothetical protein
MAQNVIRALKTKHKKIKQYFCSDMGVKLQKVQADIMLEVAECLIDQIDHCPVLVHDGCHVADIYADTCRRLMIEVAAEHGFDLGVKVNGETTSPKTEDLKPKAKVDPSVPLMDQLLSRISRWEKDDDESILSRSPWRRNTPEAFGDKYLCVGNLSLDIRNGITTMHGGKGESNDQNLWMALGLVTWTGAPSRG